MIFPTYCFYFCDEILCQLIYQVYGQVFCLFSDQIFGQFFDQGFWTRSYSVQFYQDEEIQEQTIEQLIIYTYVDSRHIS